MKGEERRGLGIASGFAVLIGTLVWLEHFLAFPDAAPALNGVLTEPQKLTISTLSDVTKLYINWAFALIAGQAWLIRRHIEGAATITRTGKITVVLGLVAGIMSVFFGQCVLSGIAEQLHHDIFSLINRCVQLPSVLQFISLLVCLSSFSVYALDNLVAPPPGLIVSGR